MRASCFSSELLRMLMDGDKRAAKSTYRLHATAAIASSLLACPSGCVPAGSLGRWRAGIHFSGTTAIICHVTPFWSGGVNCGMRLHKPGSAACESISILNDHQASQRAAYTGQFSCSFLPSSLWHLLPPATRITHTAAMAPSTPVFLLLLLAAASLTGEQRHSDAQQHKEGCRDCAIVAP